MAEPTLRTPVLKGRRSPFLLGLFCLASAQIRSLIRLIVVHLLSDLIRLILVHCRSHEFETLRRGGVLIFLEKEERVMRTLVKATLGLSFVGAMRASTSAGLLLGRAGRTYRRWRSVLPPALLQLFRRMAHMERMSAGLDHSGRRL
jgi:hypothetical protein